MKKASDILENARSFYDLSKGYRALFRNKHSRNRLQNSTYLLFIICIDVKSKGIAEFKTEYSHYRLCVNNISFRHNIKITFKGSDSIYKIPDIIDSVKLDSYLFKKSSPYNFRYLVLSFNSTMRIVMRTLRFPNSKPCKVGCLS